MRAIGIIFLLSMFLAAAMVWVLDTQGGAIQWQDSPLELPLSLMRIERQELIRIEQSIYWGDDGKLRYSEIWY